MLVQLSFNHEISFGSGSDSFELEVKGVEYVHLSEDEYVRLLAARPVIDLNWEEQAEIKIQAIDDPDLVKRISGREEFFSSHSLYHECETQYILDVSEVLTALNQIEEWNDTLAEGICQILDSDWIPHPIISRLIREYPQYCLMPWLSESEEYEHIETLLKAGRDIDEMDECSEQCNLLCYICLKDPTPSRLAAVRKLKELGSNLNLIVWGQPVRTALEECGVSSDYLKILN